jgi:hypothetical protein
MGELNKIDMTINRREIPVKPENHIKTVTKQGDGSLLVTYGSGASGIIPADEPTIQAFAVFSVLAEL